MLPIIYFRCAARAALCPGEQLSRGSSVPLQNGDRIHPFIPIPPSLQASKPFRSSEWAHHHTLPLFCIRFICTTKHSGYNSLACAWSVIPSHFTSSCCKGSLLSGRGKDNFTLCNRCSMVTKPPKCIPKPVPSAGQGPWWIAQLLSALHVLQGIPSYLTCLRRCTYYSLARPEAVPLPVNKSTLQRH